MSRELFQCLKMILLRFNSPNQKNIFQDKQYLTATATVFIKYRVSPGRTERNHELFWKGSVKNAFILKNLLETR